MTDAIDFLEQLGRNARLRHAPAAELEQALAASRIDPELRSALLADDAAARRAARRATDVCCLIVKPDGRKKKKRKTRRTRSAS